MIIARKALTSPVVTLSSGQILTREFNGKLRLSRTEVMVTLAYQAPCQLVRRSTSRRA